MKNNLFDTQTFIKRFEDSNKRGLFNNIISGGLK